MLTGKPAFGANVITISSDVLNASGPGLRIIDAVGAQWKDIPIVYYLNVLDGFKLGGRPGVDAWTDMHPDSVGFYNIWGKIGGAGGDGGSYYCWHSHLTNYYWDPNLPVSGSGGAGTPGGVAGEIVTAGQIVVGVPNALKMRGADGGEEFGGSQPIPDTGRDGTLTSGNMPQTPFGQDATYRPYIAPISSSSLLVGADGGDAIWTNHQLYINIIAPNGRLWAGAGGGGASFRGSDHNGAVITGHGTAGKGGDVTALGAETGSAQTLRFGTPSGSSNVYCGGIGGVAIVSANNPPDPVFTGVTGDPFIRGGYPGA
jgi:hypothetical protein